MAGILNKLLTEAEPTKEETYQDAQDDTVEAIESVVADNPSIAKVIKAVVKAIADEMLDEED